MLRGALTDMYIYLPAFIANAAPVIVKNLPVLRSLNRPVHALYMGKHKTWRGFLSGLIAAIAMAILQFLFTPFSLPLHEWSLIASAFIGFLLGCGALIGDMIESALKRVLRIPPGKALPYLDGVDYILGAIIFLLPLYLPSLQGLLALLLIAPIASLLANAAAYAIGWKGQWY
jgi:CDP-2,3-bis-(O-geranylgeranyl)-sn-glycerol synthase